MPGSRRFLPSKMRNLERMVAMVNEALEAGFAYRDIAVLVRNNRAAAGAERFIREGIPSSPTIP